MAVTSHLKSLQALHLAVREGSLKGAADKLGITPAAVGQRIRSLENFLGTDLLLRGRSGLQPTRELGLALSELHMAFDSLDRVTRTLDFQRVSEIHIVADPDWAELWLLPRLPEFRAENPNIRFCINGAGDVKMRLGSPDLRIFCEESAGEPLFRDIFLPVTGPDNIRRIAGRDPANQMEGMPLLHLKEQPEYTDRPHWSDWFGAFGHRQSGTDRGVHYRNARQALEAVRLNVGFLLCGLSLAFPDLRDGSAVQLFPASRHLVAPHPYRMRIRPDARNRAQIQRFADWLRRISRDMQAEIDTRAQQADMPGTADGT